MDDKTSQEYINITQAANLLGVHPATIRRWMDNELLSYISTARKKYLIPIKEVFRIQEKAGIKFIEHINGTIEYRHLHPQQQVGFLANKIDFLEMTLEKKRLEEEVKKRKEALLLAEQALRRTTINLEEHQRIFKWPNYYMNYEIVNSPNLQGVKRYNDLIKYHLLPIDS